MVFELRFYGLTNAKFGSTISDLYLDLEGFFYWPEITWMWDKTGTNRFVLKNHTIFI